MRILVTNHSAMIGLTRRFAVSVPSFAVDGLDVNVYDINDPASGFDARIKDDELKCGRWWYVLTVVYGDVPGRHVVAIATTSVRDLTVFQASSADAFQRWIGPAVDRLLDTEVAANQPTASSRDEVSK